MRFTFISSAVLAGLAFLASQSAAADPEAHTRTAKRVFLEKMGEGRFDKLDEIYGPGFVAHGGSRDYTLEEDNESGKAWRAAFPDLKVNIERTVAADELVAVHWSASGTNTVAVAGMPGTGKKAAIEGMTFFRFAEGRIVEEWSIIDMAALARQIN
jgi:steroid delta-isomerase-like uncharacterized protein